MDRRLSVIRVILGVPCDSFQGDVNMFSTLW
jgi:hypothetical protein